MTQTDVIKVVEAKLERVLSPNTVKDLTNEKVTDFERGRVRGKYEALNELIAELKNIKKSQQ